MIRPSMTSPPRAPVPQPAELKALATILALVGNKGFRAEVNAAIADFEAAREAANAVLSKIARLDEIDKLHAEAVADREAASAKLQDAQAALAEAKSQAEATLGERERALEQTAVSLRARQQKLEADEADLRVRTEAVAKQAADVEAVQAKINEIRGAA